ncbi:uncharacterized protein [Argopecten irradians]|uniref:uncharacterized protein n=1 Tax=Argopecten irradians TaxID=31199 RepID=UPI003720C24E
MASLNHHVISVVAFLVVFLVKEVECWWTNTHSYIIAGGSCSLVIMVFCITCCLRYRTFVEKRYQPARPMLIVDTHHHVVDTSSSQANPYNTGYDQRGTRSTLNSSSSDAQTTPGSPSPSNPYNTGYHQRV